MDFFNASVQDLAILAPWIAVAGIVGGALAFASKLMALWAKDESGSGRREKVAARLDLYSSLVVAATGLGALIAVLTA
ncbi:hypothetical protein ACI782_03635 [Geodermatophilus sp. SYSU D00703]